MKLKTKLLPLVGAAAVCATVAPVTLTSCGNQTALGQNVDLTKVYTPKTVQHEYGMFEYQNIMDDYFNDVMDNKEVFAEDYIWSKSKYVGLTDVLFKAILKMNSQADAQGGNAFKLNGASGEISNLSIIERQFIYKPGEESPFQDELTLKIPTASFNYKYSIDVAYEDPYTGDEIQTIVEANMDYANIPFIVVPIDVLLNMLPRGFIEEISTLLQMLNSNWVVMPFAGWMNQFSPMFKQATEKLFGVGSVGAPLAWSIKMNVSSTNIYTEQMGEVQRQRSETDSMTYDLYAQEMESWYDTQMRSNALTPGLAEVYTLLLMPDVFAGIMASEMMPEAAYNASFLLGPSAYSWYLQPSNIDMANFPWVIAKLMQMSFMK